MQTQKRSSITLSLHQEIEREVQEIEKEMARHTELDEIQVTEAMDRALIKKIQAYEKEMEEKRAAEKAGEDARKIRNASVEVEEEIISDDSDGYGKPGVKNIFYMDEDFDDSDDLVEFSEELVPDLSGMAMGNIGRERKYAGENKEGRTIYRRKKKKYLVVSLAAVLIIVLGVSVNSVGSKSYWKVLREIVVKDKPVNVISVEDMEKQNTEDIDELAAYKEIKDKIHIEPVRLMYKPAKMKLENYIIDEEMLTAQLLYKYQDDVIRYILYVNSADSSWGEKEEDTKIDEYTISVNEIIIKVEEFEKPSCEENRQVAKFQYRGVEYQLIGVMKKGELKKILENLYFF